MTNSKWIYLFSRATAHAIKGDIRIKGRKSYADILCHNANMAIQGEVKPGDLPAKCDVCLSIIRGK